MSPTLMSEISKWAGVAEEIKSEISEFGTVIRGESDFER